MALSRSLTEFPLYVLNLLKSGMYTRRNWLQTIDLSFCTGVQRSTVKSCDTVCVCVRVPVCRGTEICILQLVRTTALPAVSSLTTIGLSAGSFSMRSLTSYTCTHTVKHEAKPKERKNFISISPQTPFSITKKTTFSVGIFDKSF